MTETAIAAPARSEQDVDRSAAVAAAMAEPGFYEHAPTAVERRESHISRVFIAGERVFKTKKAVVFPFLDYGTPDRRREMCHAEVTLNRRLADDVYLGVRAIVERDGTFAFGKDDDPDAVEWAVEMRRLPIEQALDRRLAEGRLQAGMLRAVAATLVEFHRDADRAPADAGLISTLRRRIYRDLEGLADSMEAGVDPLTLYAAERFVGAFLHARRDELLRRGAAGLVRDGHGDLRLEHVLVGDGVQIVDCVEFDPFLRETDVSEDLAYLVMELVHCGASSAARELVDAYREAGGDPGDDALVAFFAAYRAIIRAKLAYLEVAATGDPDGSAAARGRALLATAAGFRWKARVPLVVVVCGPAGNGTSTLAAALHESSGLPLVSPDTTRKALAGLAPDERAPLGFHDDAVSLRTYRELGRQAAVGVAEHGGAIVDGTFGRGDDRAAFAPELRAACQVPTVFIECRAPHSSGERRAASGGLDEVAARDYLSLRTDRPTPASADIVEAWLDWRLAWGGSS